MQRVKHIKTVKKKIFILDLQTKTLFHVFTEPNKNISVTIPYKSVTNSQTISYRELTIIRDDPMTRHCGGALQ